MSFKNRIKQEDIARMWKYRREEFAIKTEIEEPSDRTYNHKSFTIMVSGNGSQFSAITVYSKEELVALYDEISTVLGREE